MKSWVYLHDKARIRCKVRERESKRERERECYQGWSNWENGASIIENGEDCRSQFDGRG
jgi:hypothetical protein